MATAHQYPEYATSNDCYGSYYNQSYGSSAYTSNGHYNFDMTSTHENNYANHYQPAANWANHYNQPTEYQTMMDQINMPYGEQCQREEQHQQPPPQQPQQQQQYQQQQRHQSHQQPAPANRFYSTPYERSPQSADNDFKDSPALRALLTNRKLGYSPEYCKKNKTKASKFQPQGNCSPATALNSIAMSPNKTEDGLEFLDEMAAYQKVAAPQYTPEQHGKVGVYPYGGTQVQSPSGMTGENMHSVSNSPTTNYVAGISTPPMSPKEAEPVNQMRLGDASSPDKATQNWIQNGKECK